MKRTVKMLFVLMFAGSVSVIAGDERDGGDVGIVRKGEVNKRIKVIEENMKTIRSDLLKFVSSLKNLEPNDVPQFYFSEDKSKKDTLLKLFSIIKDEDLINDIKESKYIRNDRLKNRDAQSGNLDAKGPVEINFQSLAEKNVTKEELIGLLFHEHIHHFGFKDKDHSLAQMVSQIYNLKNNRLITWIEKFSDGSTLISPCETEEEINRPNLYWCVQPGKAISVPLPFVNGMNLNYSTKTKINRTSDDKIFFTVKKDGYDFEISIDDFDDEIVPMYMTDRLVFKGSGDGGVAHDITVVVKKNGKLLATGTPISVEIRKDLRDCNK